MKNKITFFLLLSFLEGAAVMAAELMGAKMLSPFFGSSLYVWSTVMAITLGGLAGGYFVGGLLSTRPQPAKNLYIVLLLAAVFLVMMPLNSKIAVWLFGMRSLLPAVVASSLLILFPPIFLMGSVSPLIIRNITEEHKQAGKAAGTVYAISTVGGILATFLFGFYIIPEFGLTKPAVISGIILGVLPLYYLVKEKHYKSFVAVLFIFILAKEEFRAKENKGNLEIIYEQEGMLGQLMVIEYPNDLYYRDSTRKGEKSRWLYVNRISQTMYDPYAREDKGEEKYFTYVYRFCDYLDTLAIDKRKVLLLGLGGGILARNLSEKGFEVDACELDPRMAHVAKTYFGLPEDVQVSIDDARHHIRTTQKKYNVVIFDTFKGEETPNHIITLESLEEVKQHLLPGGIILINSFGYIEGERGLGMRSLYVTLQKSGFHTRILPTAIHEDQRNLLFIARHSNSSHPDFYPVDQLDLSDAEILVDDYPKFEKLNAAAGLRWRQLAIANYYRDINQQLLGIFE